MECSISAAMTVRNKSAGLQLNAVMTGTLYGNWNNIQEPQCGLHIASASLEGECTACAPVQATLAAVAGFPTCKGDEDIVLPHQVLFAGVPVAAQTRMCNEGILPVQQGSQGVHAHAQRAGPPPPACLRGMQRQRSCWQLVPQSVPAGCQLLSCL